VNLTAVSHIRGKTLSRHINNESELPRITGESLTRHLYRETTRPLSMTEEFRVDPYTGESDPTLI